MTEDEVRLAVKALRLDIDLDKGDTLTPTQLRAWSLIRDTYLNDLWASHHGSAEEQFGTVDQPQVQTKRSMSKYRR